MSIFGFLFLVFTIHFSHFQIFLLSLRLPLDMATVRFTQNIQRHVACPTRDVAGATLRAALDEYFRENEKARGYVLDEQGKVRRHMVVFIDGDLVHDRDSLSDAIRPDSVSDVSQALSGGHFA